MVSRIFRRFLLFFPAARQIRQQLHNYASMIQKLESDVRSSNALLAEKCLQLDEAVRLQVRIKEQISNDFIKQIEEANAQFDTLRQENKLLKAEYAELEAAYRASVEFNSNTLRALSGTDFAGRLPELSESVVFGENK